MVKRFVSRDKIENVQKLKSITLGQENESTLKRKIKGHDIKKKKIARKMKKNIIKNKNSQKRKENDDENKDNNKQRVTITGKENKNLDGKKNSKKTKTLKKNQKENINNDEDSRFVDDIFEKVKIQKKRKEKNQFLTKKKDFIKVKKTKPRKSKKIIFNRAITTPLIAKTQVPIPEKRPLTHTPIVDLNEINNKKLTEFNVVDIILSIIEIGTYHQDYSMINESSPETKLFWDSILANPDYKNIFIEKNNENSLNLSSDNIRRFFSSIASLEAQKIVEIIKENSEYIISNSQKLNLMTIGENIKTIYEGKSKNMLEINLLQENDLNLSQINIKAALTPIEKGEIIKLSENDQNFEKKLSEITELLTTEFRNLSKEFIRQMLIANYTNLAITYQKLKTINEKNNEHFNS